MNVTLAYDNKDGYVIYTQLLMPILILCQSHIDKRIKLQLNHS